MDSLTHAALGACLGELTLSKKIGKRALVWGAVAQNLPDIDVVAALWLSPSENLLVHRGITHSFVFAAGAALVLATVVLKEAKNQNLVWSQLVLFFALQIVLHDLLDTCNAYGTGLLEPFSQQRFSFHLLYVADPFFSVWACMALIALLLLRYPQASRRKWALAGIIPAGLYLGYAICNKFQVQKQIAVSLGHKHVDNPQFFVTPTPFNNWLWYAVAATDSGYYIGHQSIFAPDNSVTEFHFFHRQEELLSTAENQQEVQNLKQFADGYYTVERWNDTVVFNVLRFGQMLGWQNPQAHFTFHYFLSPAGVDNKLVMQRGRLKGWNQETLQVMFRHMFYRFNERNIH